MEDLKYDYSDTVDLLTRIQVISRVLSSSLQIYFREKMKT